MLKSGTAGMQLSRMDGAQLNSVFPTLLAVRRPGVPSGVYGEPVPLQDYMWHLIKSDFTARDNGPWRHFLRPVPSDSFAENEVRTLDLPDMDWAGTAH
jgi:hypothetical protein